MRYKKGDLVAVQWEDATGYADRWRAIDTFVTDAQEKIEDCMVLSAGIVLDHKRTHLLLAGSVHLGNASEVHRIPSSVIRRISRLKLSRK